MHPESSEKTEEQQPRQENMLLNIALNILIPTLILMKASGEDQLGPTWGLIVALAFPIGYGTYDFTRTSKVNFFSILGVISVVLTGGMSLMKVPLEYMAIKEAAIPGLIGVAVLISTYTKYPLVRVFLLHRSIIRVDKLQQALEKFNSQAAFEKSLVNATYMLAGSFFLSSTLNYFLTRAILVSPPGTEEFNAELGKLTMLSLPMIAIPSSIVMFIALFYIFKNITKLTNLHWEELLIMPEEPKKEVEAEKTND